MKARLFIFLALLAISGCGSSETVAVTDVPQGPPPPPVARRIYASFTDGSGHVALNLLHSGTSVDGRGLLRRGDTVVPAKVSGRLNGNQLDVELAPIVRAQATGGLALSGQLGGSGTWSDQDAGTSGGLTLAERTESRGGLVSFVVGVGDVSNPYQTITCVQTGDFAGTWSSAGQVLRQFNGTFSFTVDEVSGQAMIDISDGGAQIFFELVPPGQTTPWIGDSYVQPSHDTLLPGPGFVEVKD